MPEEVKLWGIGEGDTLEDICPTKLDLEQRLEAWIAQDISILSPDLLIIGRQVEADFNGVIDLLCLNRNGDVVIIELKRDRTPREVTAQALDYASWVRDLSNDRISAIANRYFDGGVSIEDAFSEKFGIDLPDVLNENHSILIVASQIDGSTERIIKYLSDTYGVNINAVTFHYFRTSRGDELLARLFLIEPERIEVQAGSKGSSKRRRNLTYDELQSIAEEKGVADLYRQFVSELSQLMKRHTTVSSIAFTGNFDGSQKAVLSLIPLKSSYEKGLHFQLYFQRLCQLFDLDENAALSLLPERREEWTYYGGAGPDYSGFAGYFQTVEEIERFLTGLKAATQS